jgi:hypothetical protein
MTYTRSMPVATLPACRKIPGHIDRAGLMWCGCCRLSRLVDDSGSPTASVAFEGDLA